MNTQLAPLKVLIVASLVAFLLGACAPWDDLPWNQKCDLGSSQLCEAPSQQTGGMGR